MSVKISLIRSSVAGCRLPVLLGVILFLFVPIHIFSQKNAAAKGAPARIIVGAERIDQYLSLIKGKHVALLVNQTSCVGKRHLADTLKSLHIDIKLIFAPEHGFRGDADAGAHVADAIDKETGTPVISLYGTKQKPSAEDLKGIDVVVYDIQDVGCRFYTFVSTLHYMMEACAQNGKRLLILDRPDPNGFYVDGPVLDLKYRSFVGISPMPVVYGLTPGEYATLAKGEKWIDSADALDMEVISCGNYDHRKKYKLPVSPSPNLKDQRAVFLYPSLCFFEGTNVSVGRGTAFPFQVIGSPYTQLDSAFTFTPQSMPGATDPPYKGRLCKGYDLRRYRKELSTEMKGVNVRYLLRMYQLCTDKAKFFSNADFFDKLAGSDQLRKQILADKTEAEIKASWQPALKTYKEMRKKYLLYAE